MLSTWMVQVQSAGNLNCFVTDCITTGRLTGLEKKVRLLTRLIAKYFLLHKAF